MAHDADDRNARNEPGMAAALLTILAMIGTIAVLSLLIWVLMVAVNSTTAGRHEQVSPPASSAPMIDQKALPGKQP